MSKANDLAQKAYPQEIDDYCENNAAMRVGFKIGYRQAEKDLELTYDDICEIMEIREDVLEMDSYENLYEEILKRFKKLKPDGSQMTKQV